MSKILNLIRPVLGTDGNVTYTSLCKFPINSGAKKKFTLGKEDYIKVSFSTHDELSLNIGDGIDDDDIGVYKLKKRYKPTYDESTHSYKYDLQFDSYYMLWANFLMVYNPSVAAGELSFGLTGRLELHSELLKSNLKANGFKYRGLDFVVVIDTANIKNEAKLVECDGTDTITYLNTLCNEDNFNCEWWVVKNRIYFGKCEYDKDSAQEEDYFNDVQFEIGKNCNSMKANEAQDEFANRIYIFGGTNNITGRYRKNLIYRATEVTPYNSTRKLIKDSSRPLLPVYFKLSELSYIGKYDIDKSLSSSITSVDSFVVPTDVFYSSAGAFDLSALTLTLTLLNSSNQTIDPSGTTQSVQAKFVCKVNDNGIVTEKIAGTASFDCTSMKNLQFSVNDAYSNTHYIESACIHIDITSNVISNNAAVKKISCTGSISVSGPSALINTKLRYKGTTYDVVINSRRSGVYDMDILLPDNLSIAVGDEYTLPNIVLGKVPSSQFTAAEGANNNDLVYQGAVQKRLMLPAGTPYIQTDTTLTQEQIKVAILTYDDIYPRFSGQKITSASSVEYVERSDDGDISKKYLIYTIGDKNLTFDNNSIIENTAPMIIFQTGKLAGNSFKVAYDGNVDGESRFTIEHDDNLDLPNSTLQPSVGDEYILYNIDPSYYFAGGTGTLEDKAEQELLEQGEKDAKDILNIDDTFDCELKSDIVNKGNISYQVGQKVTLCNNNYFSSGTRESRVIGYEINLDRPYDRPVYSVGNSVKYSLITDIESKLEKVKYNGNTYYGGANTLSSSSSLYVVNLNDTSKLTDTNTMSSLRALKEIGDRALSKLHDDTVQGLITFLKGLKLGIDKGLDENGNANLLSLLVNSLYGIDKDGNATLNSVFLGGFEHMVQGLGLYKNSAGHWCIECDDMFVRMKAVFEALEIRKMYSSAGNINISPSGSNITRVEWLDASGNVTEVAADTVAYKCYFLADDGTTATANSWQTKDYALCKTFNIKEGAYANVSNQYYWRKVTDVGSGYITLGNMTGQYDVGSTVPQTGDSVVMRGSDTDGRMSYIEILSNDDNAPAILMWADCMGFASKGQNTAIISPEKVEFATKVFRLIDYDNVATPVVIYKGAYADNKVYYYNNSVTYNGSLWVLDGVAVGASAAAGTEPVDGSAVWTKQVSKGGNGNGISSVTRMYITSTAAPGSGSEPTDSTTYVWASYADAIAGGAGSNGHAWDATWKYLYCREVTVYTDGTRNVVISLSSIFVVNGKDGVGISSTTITYQLGISGTVAPTGTWNGSVPTLVKGQYLWTKTVWTYTDSTSETGYSVSYVSMDGNNGSDGLAGKDGVGISDTTITYQIGDSGTTAPTGTWSSTVPTSIPGKYLWTRTVWTYTDSTNETGYSVSKYGEKGDTGNDGIAGKDGDDGKSAPYLVLTMDGEQRDTVTLSTADNGLVSGTLTDGNAYVTLASKIKIRYTIVNGTLKSGSSPEYVGTNCILTTTDITKLATQSITYTDASNNTQTAYINVTEATVIISVPLADGTTITGTYHIKVDVSRYTGGIYWDNKTFRTGYESWKTDVDGTLTDYQSSISDNADSISAEVTSRENADSVLTTSVGTISAKADAISLSVANKTSEKLNLIPNSFPRAVSHYYGGYTRSVYLAAGTYVLSANGRVNSVLPANRILKIFLYNAGWTQVFALSFDATTAQSCNVTNYSRVKDTTLWTTISITQAGIYNVDFYDYKDGDITTDTSGGRVIVNWMCLTAGTVRLPWSRCASDTEVGTNMLPAFFEKWNFHNGTVTSNGYKMADGANVDVLQSSQTILTYSASTPYAIGDYVMYTVGTQTLCYKCIKAAQGIAPTNTTYWTASDNDYEILQHTTTVEAKKTYTLSFYAKGSGTIYAMLFKDSYSVCQGAVGSQGQTSSADNGVTEFQLSTAWTRMWVTFTTDTVSGSVNLWLRGHNTFASYIAGVKLEEGGLATDGLSKSDLLASGIDITSHKILATSDNFYLQNNSGQLSAAVDESGNLSAGSLSTMHSNGNPYIFIKDGIMEVHGNIAINIRFGVNANGMAVLSYYDNSGKLLYDLGPSGITASDLAKSQWEEVTFVSIVTIGYTESTVPAADTNVMLQDAKKLFTLNSIYNITTLYRYHAGMVNGVAVKDAICGFADANSASSADGMLFTAKYAGNLCTGTYTQNNGSYIPMSVDKNYYKEFVSIVQGSITSKKWLCSSYLYQTANSIKEI